MDAITPPRFGLIAAIGIVAMVVARSEPQVAHDPWRLCEAEPAADLARLKAGHAALDARLAREVEQLARAQTKAELDAARQRIERIRDDYAALAAREVVVDRQCVSRSERSRFEVEIELEQKEILIDRLGALRFEQPIHGCGGTREREEALAKLIELQRLRDEMVLRVKRARKAAETGRVRQPDVRADRLL